MTTFNFGSQNQTNPMKLKTITLIEHTIATMLNAEDKVTSGSDTLNITHAHGGVPSFP
jgi:hypothetical protein